ncbi:MAG: hypothetical protein AB1Z98_31090 [Nannocystaceae bacterium]
MGLRGPIRIAPGQTHCDALLGRCWAWETDSSNVVTVRTASEPRPASRRRVRLAAAS